MTRKIEYTEIDQALMCSIPEDAEIDMEIIDKIVKNTDNTWQPDRGENELKKNTIMGKKAELVLEKYLFQYCDLRYQSYDDFRKDDFKKHAPFDGILYHKDVKESDVKECIEKINAEISAGGKFGKLTPDLRRYLEDKGVFTIEIKSSNLKNNDYDGVKKSKVRTEEDKKTIIKNIEKRDFFIYPHYLRNTDTITNFYEYAEYVRGKITKYSNLGNKKALVELITDEYENASDIYTRLYFDLDTNEIYIPGYILKEDFFVKPYINKMPGAKSGKALYYMYSISNRKGFSSIAKDERLMNYDRVKVYEKLFAHKKEICTCGEELQICNNTEKKQYFYKCYKCNKTCSM